MYGHTSTIPQGFPRGMSLDRFLSYPELLMKVAAAIVDPLPFRVKRRSRSVSAGRNECVIVVCEIRDTLHEERALSDFATNRHE